jgi:hypothetical protein
LKFAHVISICSLAFVVAMLGICAPATAQTQNEADASYNAWNSAFLVQNNGKPYYATTLTSLGTVPSGTWIDALNIAVAEDVYERNHSQAQQNLVSALLTTFLVQNGTDWSYDGWNDDIGWMTNIFVRGYQITGNPTFLAQAETGWNLAYNRGWDTTLGGGIWENSTESDKEALSNDSFVFEGVALYQITGDPSYLAKAEAIYAWVRATLFNPTNATNAVGAPGQVTQGINNNGSLNAGDNVYNSGTFLKAANDLLRVTGNQTYYNDALLAANHIVNEGPVLHNGNEAPGNQWAYWFTLALSEFATDNNQWPQYQSWLQGNADAAWSERSSLNLTWNDWTSPTNDDGTDALEMSSAVAIWQVLPAANPPTLSGNYEIENTASNLALSVAGSSTANSAAVIQESFDGGDEDLWTMVPTSGGYFQIKNVNSGLVVSVTEASGASGANIIQSPAQGMMPGNDQWLPAQNSDGTYSFFNLNSLQVLDNPGASTVAGTQVDQSFANGTPAQKFYLIPQSATSTSTPTAPTAPPSLSAELTSTNLINLSWTASATPGATYAIFRSTTSGFPPSSGNLIASASSSTTTFIDGSVSPSTTYYYLVEATDSNGTSAASNEASATTPTPSFLLGLSAPSVSLTAGSSGTDTVTVTPQDGLPTSASISFTCSGQPATITCSFSPTTVTAGNIVSTLTVSATKASSALYSRRIPLFPGSALALMLGFFGWKRRRRFKLVLLVVSVFGLTIFTGCGGSSSASSTAPPTSVVYPVTVTATYASGSGSTVAQTAQLEVVTTN